MGDELAEKVRAVHEQMACATDLLQESYETAMERAEGSDARTLQELEADAKDAWESGQGHYLPLINAFSRPVDSGIPRARGAEIALDVVTAVGWRLHTWQWGEAGPFGTTTARPLFVRPTT